LFYSSTNRVTGGRLQKVAPPGIVVVWQTFAALL
jgi:hypothetical protein